MANEKSNTVSLEPADFRVDEFNSGVEGVEPIRKGGTEVPAGKEEEVRNAAKRAGVSLKKA